MTKEEFRKAHRPINPAIAAEWDRDFDFHWGEQWSAEEVRTLQAKPLEINTIHERE